MRRTAKPRRARRKREQVQEEDRRGRHRTSTHGLYTKRLSAEEREILESMPVEQVDGEIAMQRAFVSRLAGILGENGLGPDDREGLSGDTQKTMKLLTVALAELRHYVRMRERDLKRLNDPAKEIEEGKNLARRRHGVFEYLRGRTDEEEDIEEEEPEAVDT